MRRFFWLSALVGLLSAASALAQGTPAQRAACEGDAYRLCEAQVPDAVAVEKCLRANAGSLSSACRAEFGFPGGAAAGKKHGK